MLAEAGLIKSMIAKVPAASAAWTIDIPVPPAGRTSGISEARSIAQQLRPIVQARTFMMAL